MKHKKYLHDRPLVAIDISPTFLKIMAINRKHWLVTGYGSVSVDPQKLQIGLNDDPAYLIESLNELVANNVVGKLPSDHAVVTIPTNRSYSRSVSVPVSAANSLDSAIQLEAEQYIPIPISELNLSYEIIARTKETIEVLMSAAPKKIVANAVKACREAGFEVIAVEPSINAVARLITLTEEGHLPTVIVDIGAAATDIAILDKSIRATGSVQVGGNTFTYDISQKMNISLEKAHQLKVLNGLNVSPKQAKIKAALSTSLEQVASEVQKIIRYYNERINEKQKIEQVVIVGGGSNVPGLGDYFTDKLTMPVRVASPWQVLDFGKLPQPSKQFKPRYITVAGLASIVPKDVWS